MRKLQHRKVIFMMYIKYVMKFSVSFLAYIQNQNTSLPSPPWSKPPLLLSWNSSVFCCFCPCPIWCIRIIAGYYTINSDMSQLISKSSNGFPFHLEKNTKSPFIVYKALYYFCIHLVFHHSILRSFWSTVFLFVYLFILSQTSLFKVWSLQVLLPLHGKCFP